MLQTYWKISGGSARQLRLPGIWGEDSTSGRERSPRRLRPEQKHPLTVVRELLLEGGDLGGLRGPEPEPEPGVDLVVWRRHRQALDLWFRWYDRDSEPAVQYARTFDPTQRAVVEGLHPTVFRIRRLLGD